MENKTLNVLSIDFDYFQNVKESTLHTHYPDGVDSIIPIATQIWNTHYANPQSNRALLQITPLTKQLEEIKDIIHKSSKKHAPESLIVNSHQYAYDFITDYLYDNPDFTTVNLVNIDMHHDLFNDNFNIDCGNWIGHLKDYLKKKKIKTHITWIPNPISIQMYDLTEEELQGHVQDDFSTIQDTVWDLIFLCRSDIWSVPHLDNEFVKLANHILNHSSHADYEEGIIENRYTQEFIDNYKKLQKFYERSMKEHAGK